MAWLHDSHSHSHRDSLPSKATQPSLCTGIVNNMKIETEGENGEGVGRDSRSVKSSGFAMVLLTVDSSCEFGPGY